MIMTMDCPNCGGTLGCSTACAVCRRVTQAPGVLATTLTEPIGHRPSQAILCGRLETVQMPIYSPESEAAGHGVRMLRAPLGLRDAARRLGVTATWLSEVEIGRRTLTHYTGALRVMREAWGAGQCICGSPHCPECGEG